MGNAESLQLIDPLCCDGADTRWSAEEFQSAETPRMLGARTSNPHYGLTKGRVHTGWGKSHSSLSQQDQPPGPASSQPGSPSRHPLVGPGVSDHNLVESVHGLYADLPDSEGNIAARLEPVALPGESPPLTSINMGALLDFDNSASTPRAPIPSFAQSSPRRSSIGVIHEEPRDEMVIPSLAIASASSWDDLHSPLWPHAVLIFTALRGP